MLNMFDGEAETSPLFDDLFSELNFDSDEMEYVFSTQLPESLETDSSVRSDFSSSDSDDSLGEPSVSEEIKCIKKEWLITDSYGKRSRAPRLFEFLVLLLKKPKYQSYASFLDRFKGTFQIHEPTRVAELWQKVKSRQSNQKMTYDKFARAIRWYYKSNIMQKTNTRYTFQFSPKILKTYFHRGSEDELSSSWSNEQWQKHNIEKIEPDSELF